MLEDLSMDKNDVITNSTRIAIKALNKGTDHAEEALKCITGETDESVEILMLAAELIINAEQEGLEMLDAFTIRYRDITGRDSSILTMILFVYFIEVALDCDVDWGKVLEHFKKDVSK